MTPTLAAGVRAITAHQDGDHPIRCQLGALVAELAEGDPDARAALDDEFGRWAAALAAGVRRRGSVTVQLRVARHTERLAELVAFYRDGLGPREIGGFRDHAGYDGVFLAIPGTGAHLELTTGGGHGAPVPHPESLLVLYLGDERTVQAVAARLALEAVEPANPYWAGHGLTFADPDGFRVVLVPERWAP